MPRKCFLKHNLSKKKNGAKHRNGADKCPLTYWAYSSPLMFQFRDRKFVLREPEILILNTLGTHTQNAKRKWVILICIHSRLL